MFKGFLEKLKRGLEKTTKALSSRFLQLFAPGRLVDEAFLSELEETLIVSDVGVETVKRVCDDLRKAFKERRIESAEQALAFIKTEFKKRLAGDAAMRFAPSGPTAVLITGVNGSGKTTSIAKLCQFYRAQNKSVLLAAGDTFRAAAADQLEIWSKRLGVEIVRHQHGADPAAVVFDACDAAIARKVDLLIIDTAGRLQTKEHLMRELAKIRGVAAKKIPGAPHESLLVIDATTGQNAISQAEHFNQAAVLTGIFLSKLDGTAKGGIVLAVREKFNLPVKFVGLGETPDDIAPFNADEFVEALFSKDDK